MLGENLHIEFEILAMEALKLLDENQELWLKTLFTSNCNKCDNAPKLVYVSPEAYRVSQLISSMKEKNFI